MSFNFDIHHEKYCSIGELCFQVNDKKYEFKFSVCTPDTDDFSENLNAHYFTYTFTNEYGSKLKYVEYIDCFFVLASKINSIKNLSLFNLYIDKEFTLDEKIRLKQIFLELHDCVVEKVKNFYSL